MPLIKKAVKTAKPRKSARAKVPAKTTARKPRLKKAAPKKPEPWLEQRAEESKYYAGPVIQKFAEEKPYELPPGYGDNLIVLMVRDPFWLFTYWEISGQRRDEIKKEVGEPAFNGLQERLRVYDTQDWRSFDVEISSGARNWYVRVPASNRTYCVDIGYITANGKFITAARSNWVTTPLDRMSEAIDEQWMIPDWERIYALSGGFGVGRGSEEIREMMKRRLQEGLSSGLFSLSSPSRQMGERPFWLVANCELIVYGATEPSATLTVQGHKIDLREDGTFTLRFALPDGKQVIPIEAIRDDGAERRKITPIVERRTE
jgi:hypothetical protein